MSTNYSAIQELENIIKHHRHFGTMNRIIGDWFNAFSIIISVAIPAMLILQNQFSKEVQNKFNLYLLIFSTVGLILTLVNNIFKFRQRSELNYQILNTCCEIKRNFCSSIIDEKELVQQINLVKNKELVEVNCF